MSIEPVRTIRWALGSLEIVDQNALPGHFCYIRIESAEALIAAIKRLAVRGAPALGAAGAYGVALAIADSRGDLKVYRQLTTAVREARPTAVNLAWGVDRVCRAISQMIADGRWHEAFDSAVAEANQICEKDIAANGALAAAGQELVPDPAVVVTHCNTGDLATVSGGTALGVLLEAHRQGKRLTVYADETRPRMQGARLTAWELGRAGVETYVMPDGAAAALMAHRKIDLVIVGADRIARSGDTANKIGTYSLAISAARHGVPFYVAAPLSTVDVNCAVGADIRIEMRDPSEVLAASGADAIQGVQAYNPSFDVTPADLITCFVTEAGIIRPPYADSLKSACSGGRTLTTERAAANGTA